MQNSYYSPFPREKSNNEALKKSYTICNERNQTFIEIPATVTASYMQRNPFYFDLEKTKKAKSERQSKAIHSQSDTRKYTLFANKRLDKILNSSKAVKINTSIQDQS